LVIGVSWRSEGGGKTKRPPDREVEERAGDAAGALPDEYDEGAKAGTHQPVSVADHARDDNPAA
jgi:hypothetical protein